MSDLGPGPVPESRHARLWRNHKRYCGETIKIEDVLSQCLEVAKAAHWRIESMLPGALHGLPALVRAPAHSAGPALYVSTGIHGDEPAGPLAALALLQQNPWPSGMAVYLCPCLNPEGFELNTRENASGVDLNRQYRNPQASETIAHTRWLKRQPAFDLALCLHEDWEASGFYVYELNPAGRASFAPRIVAAAETACPVDRSEVIESWPARDGIIRPGLNPDLRPDWPEAFYLITNKTRTSYTLEAPSDYPLHVRTAALVEGTKAAAEALTMSWKPPLEQ